MDTGTDLIVSLRPTIQGQESEQTLGDGDEQGSLACCSPWGRKESDMTD